ncbi:MAG: hypothetical protein MUC96_28175 [Myxococcaceae bacterium]|jgi:hypothetical protein|nr:hypothetical protein [Myxococcaceae bacterium]
MRGASWLLIVMIGARSLAQQPSAPPLPEPVPEVAPAPVPLEPPPPTAAPIPTPAPTFLQQCFGFPAGAYLVPIPRVGVNVGGPAPVAPGRGASTTGSGGGGFGSLGGGDGKAALVIVVLVALALPVVVYALDSDAPRIVEQRFFCPSFQVEVQGGALTGRELPGVHPVGAGRVSFGAGHFGLDAQFDFAPSAINTFGTHLQLRLTPKQHLEGALAAGYRQMNVGSDVRGGFDVGLPHRYAFWRDDLRTFGLEVRPALQFGPRGIDASLEAALVVPLLDVLHLKLGGRVFSFGEAIVWGGSGGLVFGL